jgi:AAA family ATP:ADP antiporter
MSSLVTSPRTPSDSQKTKPGIFVMFEGFWLIMRSPYLRYISLFLWMSAVISSFFYFQVWYFSICVLTSRQQVLQCCEHAACFNKWSEYKGLLFTPPVTFLPDFQKVTIVATTISSPAARRRTFALINSFIAVFILAGQLTLTVFSPSPNYPHFALLC